MINLILIVAIIFLVALIIKQTIANQQQAKENIALEKEFLEKNKAQDNLICHDSGLQYQVISRSESDIAVPANANLTVHYHGTLIDGTVFDSSVDRNTPITFKLSQVIKGWQIAMVELHQGDKARLYIPHHLAYGKRRVGKIPPASLLIFEIEIISVS